MADILSPRERSRRMAQIGQKNTAPELAIRHGLHALGLRYRLHVSDLPGRPDLVFPKYRVALFIHGCFWHGHTCRAGRNPASNVEYWEQKIAQNRARDMRKAKELEALGWRVLTVWECEAKSAKALNMTLERLDCQICGL